MEQPEPLSTTDTAGHEEGHNVDAEKPSGDDGHQLEHAPSATDSTSPPPAPRIPVAVEESPPATDEVYFVPYLSELQMPSIVQLMKGSLSEPYSIYTYRYFIHKWPQLCKLAMFKGECVGAIVCKLEAHHFNIRRGYIAMLAVAKEFRRMKIGMYFFNCGIINFYEIIFVRCGVVVNSGE